jgi:Flp pilus assembly protein TadD
MRRLPLSIATALCIVVANIAPASADDSDAKSPAIDLTPPSNLDDAIHDAQIERTTGKLDDATKSLSQLMLVAPDDPRVVGEYGKLLVEEGQGGDGVQFLHRAIELSANDWTLYSALGVAFDEVGNAGDAGLAYRHALALKPGEPVILNNIAMSRLAIGDLKGAHEMLVAAQAAGGGDEQITKNLAMVEAKLPRTVANAPTAPAKTTTPVTSTEPVAQAPATKPSGVEVAALPNAKALGTEASGAPRNIVMQAVPHDPLAGTTGAKKWVKHRPAVAHVTTASTVATAVKPAKPVAAVAAKPATVAEHKANKTPSLRMSADAS